MFGKFSALWSAFIWIDCGEQEHFVLSLKFAASLPPSNFPIYLPSPLYESTEKCENFLLSLCEVVTRAKRAQRIRFISIFFDSMLLNSVNVCSGERMHRRNVHEGRLVSIYLVVPRRVGCTHGGSWFENVWFICLVRV